MREAQPLVLAPAHTTVDAVPTGVLASMPPATMTWLAPLSYLVTLVFAPTHTTTAAVPARGVAPTAEETPTCMRGPPW